jgi:hypothetical protein
VLQQVPLPFPGPAQHQWIARLTLVEGDETRGSWLDFWRQAMSGGAGGGATSVASLPPGTGGGTTTTILGQTIVYLGGCRTTSQMTAGAWVPIVDFVDVLLNAADGAGRTVRCHSWVLVNTMTINVRVVALTDPVTVVGTGIVTSATDQFVNDAFQEFGITLVGHNYYRVEMQTSVTGDGWVAGAVCYPGAWLVAPPEPEPPGPLVRVQALPKVLGDNVTSIALTFSTAPTVGNGILVTVHAYRNPSAPTLTCTDNRGHTYTADVSQVHGRSRVSIFSLPAVTDATAPFTITITASLASYFVATAIEVSGVGAGLVVDAITSAMPINTSAPSVPATPALTVDEVFVAAVIGYNANTTVTVASVTPAWTQEAEETNFSLHAVGEVDSRILTGVVGTTTSAAWTFGMSVANPAMVLAAYRGT